MKTIVVTSYSEGGEHEELAKLTVPNMQKYCDRHEYDFAALKIPYTNDGHVMGLKAIRDYLHSHETVMSVGADVLFMNHTKRIENIAKYPVTLAKEHISSWPINNDVMIWRRGIGATNLLDTLIRAAEIWLKYPWFWQNHLWNLICKNQTIRSSVDIVEARVMNSTIQPGLSQWQIGDFILHLLNMPTRSKINNAKKYLPYAGDGSYYPTQP